MDEILVVVRVVVSLAAVLGLMLWLGRRLQKGQNTRNNPLAGLVPAKLAERFVPSGPARPRARAQAAEKITVVARAGLGGRAQLVVAEFGGVRYVLGVTERDIQVVDTLEVPVEVSAEQPAEAIVTATADVVGERRAARLARFEGIAAAARQ
ncbi:flagellar biosynthetic protein FliO [Microbacterium keratanolyticum]